MEKVCRATYSVDGEEYEGTVVNKNVGNKSVTVRFHGYNNEEEVTKRVQHHVHDIKPKGGDQILICEVEQPLHLPPGKQSRDLQKFPIKDHCDLGKYFG